MMEHVRLMLTIEQEGDIVTHNPLALRSRSERSDTEAYANQLEESSDDSEYCESHSDIAAGWMTCTLFAMTING